MPRPTPENVPPVFAPHLQPGEQLRYFAYGVKQPNILLILVLVCLAVLPGLIATAILTKHFLIGLTDKRLLVLRIASMGNHGVKEVLEYPLGSLTPAQVKTSTGALFTHIRIDDPAKPFVAKFHRLGMKTNRDHSMAIAAAISSRALPA
ncbi:MAG TPA: hypothetical protein VG389_07280 [Myxococcota bacterium]|jgi:hypothetical protein|nr:hypothetical protein [Myxococcota bacterium]